MTQLSSSPSLRFALRQARRALPNATRQLSNLKITNTLVRLLQVRISRHVALYLSEDGEVDLTALLRWGAGTNRLLALPVLRRGRRRSLWFCQYSPTTRLYPNRFGIGEPDSHHHPPIPLRNLDVVLMPLVGFDDQLNRLGMGGGYYDRTFGPMRLSAKRRRPLLIGIAYECQRVEALQQRPWDVPMDLVVTELGIYRGKGAEVVKVGNPHKKVFT